MTKVSIIVPIYNSEKTLAKCLDSILVQTLSDIEILCIDDECKDKSRQIVDEYAQKDSRIVPIHLSGKGSYGRAVNLGFNRANAEYVGIVETDDWCHEKMFETLYNMAIKKNADIAMCSWFVMKDLERNKYDYHNYLKNTDTELGEIFNVKTHPKILDESAYPWKNLYKKEFILKNNLKFREDLGGSYQDIVFNAEILSKASAIVSTQEPLYYYNLGNIESTTSNGRTSVLYPLRRTQTRQVLVDNNIFADDDAKEYFWHRSFIGLRFFYERTIKEYKNEYYKEMLKFLLLSKQDNVTFKYFSREEKKCFKLYLKCKNNFIYNLYKNLKKLYKFVFKKQFADILMKDCPFVIKFLDNILPKDNESVVFFASPDFGDNTKALCDYILKNNPDYYKRIYFLYKNKWWTKNLYKYQNLFTKADNMRFVHINSLWGIKTLLKCKTYIINETIIRDCSKVLSDKHTIINLWHGMPIKTIGYLEKNASDVVKRDYEFLGRNSYLFATSDIFKSIMSNSFLCDPKKVFITGQPKTDCILENDKKDVFNEYLDLDKYSKVILYAPTYRELCRANDIHPIFKNIFYCDDYKETDFYNYLEKNNILFIFKPHLFDERFYNKNEGLVNFDHPNIKYVGDIFFKNTNTNLYELFKYTDVLISDFSSITIDYLISNKPVIYLLSSKEAYSNERGMSLEDNYEIFMPGIKAYNFADVLSGLKDAFETDSTKINRMQTLPLLHKYIDSNACQRVWDVIQNIEKRS